MEKDAKQMPTDVAARCRNLLKAKDRGRMLERFTSLVEWARNEAKSHDDIAANAEECVLAVGKMVAENVQAIDRGSGTVKDPRRFPWEASKELLKCKLWQWLAQRIKMQPSGLRRLHDEIVEVRRNGGAKSAAVAPSSVSKRVAVAASASKAALPLPSSATPAAADGRPIVQRQPCAGPGAAVTAADESGRVTSY